MHQLIKKHALLTNTMVPTGDPCSNGFFSLPHNICSFDYLDSSILHEFSSTTACDESCYNRLQTLPIDAVDDELYINSKKLFLKFDNEGRIHGYLKDLNIYHPEFTCSTEISFFENIYNIIHSDFSLSTDQLKGDNALGYFYNPFSLVPKNKNNFHEEFHQINEFICLMASESKKKMKVF